MARRSKGLGYLSPRDDGEQAIGCCMVITLKPVGHDYAVEVLEGVCEVLSLRAEERRQAIYRP